MLLKHLRNNNVLINNIWGYAPPVHEPFYLQWITALKRTHRIIEFTNDDNVKKIGYSQKYSTLYEPFALHVKDLYGDGVYWLETNGNFYFLIIANGEPVSGSDKIVSPRFWIRLREQIKSDIRYQHLLFEELNEEKINCIIEHCDAHQQHLRKKRRIKIIGLAACGIVIMFSILLLTEFFMKKG